MMPNLTLTLNRERRPVASIHDAQLAVRELSNQIGGTEFHRSHPTKGAVVRDGNRIVGHISYNARWWPVGLPHVDGLQNHLGDLIHSHVVHHPNPKENAMSKSKAPKKPAANAKEPVVVTTATKKAAVKSAKPATTQEAPKKEKAPKEDLMVFAFRLTKEESAAIHKAAGPGKASKFARSILVAAAQNDEAEVKAILKSVHTAA